MFWCVCEILLIVSIKCEKNEFFLKEKKEMNKLAGFYVLKNNVKKT